MISGALLEADRYDIPNLLIDKGIQINDLGNRFSRAPLTLAVEDGSFKINNGINVNTKDMKLDDWCNSTLHSAAKRGEFEITRLLLENGARRH